MAPPETTRDVSPFDLPIEQSHDSLFSHWFQWLESEGLWWFTSFAFHLILICSLALFSTQVVKTVVDEGPSFDAATVLPAAEAPQVVQPFDVINAPLEPTELSPDTLLLEPPGAIVVEEPEVEEIVSADKGGGVATTSNQPDVGGMGGMSFRALGPGPLLQGTGGVGVGKGAGNRPGSGGDEWGLTGRGARRKKMAGIGSTKESERAVAAALSWLARHQMPDGSWSIGKFDTRCKDKSCAGIGSVDHTTAATAMGLLPFLAAGQTHEAKGPYKKNVLAGILWLLKSQQPNGDLRGNGNMYAHGLAAITLCECYGMTNNRQVGHAARGALKFIVDSQDSVGGGWRYYPGEAGDVSVTGWQIMALKSGQMANLAVDSAVFDKAKKFLASASAGKNQGLFRYTPVMPSPGLAMTSVGLLCEQYLLMPRTDPAMLEGVEFLMQHLPDPDGPDGHNLYYWYYATQVMHNIPGPDWDAWNRKMRRVLIENQVKDVCCATGSWDPRAGGNKMVKRNDPYGPQGGRLMMTSLGALTLEVYYRYLPLYKLDQVPDVQAIPESDEQDEPSPAASQSPVDDDDDDE